MALSVLSGEKRKVYLGERLSAQAVIVLIEFDAVVSESHSGDAEVTDFPVEDGTDLSDHHRRLPEQITINGIVTNDPIKILASIRATPAVPGTDPSARAEEAYKEIKRIKDEGVRVSVFTTLRTYDDMMITGFTTTRDAQNGNVLNASISLREVITASTEKVDPPVAKKVDGKDKKKQTKDSKGKHSTTEAPVKNKSVASRIVNSLGGDK